MTLSYLELVLCMTVDLQNATSYVRMFIVKVKNGNYCFIRFQMDSPTCELFI